MIVGQFHVVCRVPDPTETNAPLIVDADTELPGPVAAQGFEAIARRIAQVVETIRAVKQHHLAICRPLNIGSEAPDKFAPPYRVCIAISEAYYHVMIISCNDIKIKSQTSARLPGPLRSRTDERSAAAHPRCFARERRHHGCFADGEAAAGFDGSLFAEAAVEEGLEDLRVDGAYPAAAPLEPSAIFD
jgi:hypothetical protein